jgi:hypothetical protein
MLTVGFAAKLRDWLGETGAAAWATGAEADSAGAHSS